MSDDKYILKGHEAVPVTDLLEWAKWLDTANRRVERTRIGEIEVSTVFLGLDHSFGGGPPLLFETMVFGGPLDHYQWRCSTWDEAVAQHAEAVRQVQAQTETVPGPTTTHPEAKKENTE